MELTSTTFKESENIPKKFTCDGENVSPPLNISNVPEKAQSLALIMDDPDSPGGDFVHWLVWNMPANTTEIAEGYLPSGSIVGTTSFGKEGYGGPCPGQGAHRYQFKLFALDIPLELEPKAQKNDLIQAMEGHIVSEAMLTGIYQRG